jgi:hypothetical protein
MTAAALRELLVRMREAAPADARAVSVSIGLAGHGQDCLELRWTMPCPCDAAELLGAQIAVEPEFADRRHGGADAPLFAWEIEQARGRMAAEWAQHRGARACYVCHVADARPIALVSLPAPARGLVYVHADCKGKLR